MRFGCSCMCPCVAGVFRSYVLKLLHRSTFWQHLLRAIHNIIGRRLSWGRHAWSLLHVIAVSARRQLETLLYIASIPSLWLRILNESLADFLPHTVF